MRIKFAVGFMAAVAVAAVAPVRTVTHGQPDGNNHPYVGIVIQPIPSMPGFVSVCSGSAIAPTRFLTAAHCFDPSQPVFVSFKSGPPFGGTFISGTGHLHPDWCLGCGSGLPGFDTHDVAVVALAAPVSLPAFAVLPTVGLVDTLAMRTPVDVVGYGVQGFIRGGGPPEGVFTAIRFFAVTELIQSNNRTSAEFIKLTLNPAQDKGGACFGDSGGPDLLHDTDTVLAVNSYGTNTNCAGVGYSQRVDLQDILTFINSI